MTVLSILHLAYLSLIIILDEIEVAEQELQALLLKAG